MGSLKRDSHQAPVRRALASAVLLVAAGACGPHAPESAGPRSSLLLVTIDTVRADHLGCYGATEAHTPNLDRLAQDGVQFLAARTCVPLTLPSHVTMMTGTLPPCHGVHDNAVSYLTPEAVTLAELLVQQGYRTGAFVSAFVLDHKFGLDQGFEAYGDVKPRTLASGITLEERRGSETVEEARAWLHGLEERRPFFLWVHLFDAHYPYQPPPPYDAQLAGRPYDGEIAYVDALVGELLAAARARAPSLLVTVLADHGESLGEHGEQTHGLFVYDATMRIPWLMSGASLPRAVRVSTPVRTVDLLPTLAELLGFEAPLTAQGRSLMDVIAGRSSDVEPIYMESFYGYLNFRWSPLLALSDGTYKVIDAPRPELYQLSSDPGETTDLSTRDAARLDAMRSAARAQLARWQCGRGFSAEYQGTAEDREALRKLGYVGQSEGGDVPLPGKGADPKDMAITLAARDQAMMLIDRGRLEEAMQIIAAALAKDPNNAPLLEFQGVCLARRERCQEAIEPLMKAVALRPDRIDAQYALAHCYSRLGNASAALERLDKCLELNPSFLKAAKLRADLCGSLGQKAEAARWYQYFLDRWQGDAKTREQIELLLAQAKSN